MMELVLSVMYGSIAFHSPFAMSVLEITLWCVILAFVFMGVFADDRYLIPASILVIAAIMLTFK
jgi:hypothetical protein